MKKLLFILFICLSFVLNAQEGKLVTRYVTCESGQEQAEKDFSDGKYVLYSFSLDSSISGVDYGFVKYYNNYIFDKYGFKYESKGCVRMTSDECYNSRMEELLFEKYGSDMFIKAKQEAIKGFKNTEDYNRILEDIKKDKVFYRSLVHEEPQFPGGKESFEEFLEVKIGLDSNSDWEDYINVSFYVEKNGTISDIELENFIDNKPYVGVKADLIIEKLKTMPKWKPAVYFGNKVKTYETIRIPK